MSDDAFFTALGDGRYLGTAWTQGPWRPGEQHGGPPSALLARALEACEPRDDARLVRITVELLGPVPVGEVTVEARLMRPGRSVQLLEGTLSAGGRPVLSARAWRVRTAALPEATTAGETPPARPDEGPRRDAWETDVGYGGAIEWRWVTGSFYERGPAVVWTRMRIPLVAGEEPSPVQRVLAVADSGNGASSEVELARWLFVNPDLTVVVARPPEGPWICLDARTRLAGDGTGSAETVLWAESGRVGLGLQSLFVAPRP